MAQVGPISRAQDPGFNILGLLLGGRGYAANYFAQQDQRQRDLVDEQRRGDFATGLLRSPEFNTAVKDPGLRQQYGLWSKFAGGPSDFTGLGNSLLDKAVGNYYGKDLSTFQDGLERGRIDYSADVALKADQIKRDRDQAAIGKLGEYLTAGGAHNQILRNYAAKQLGIDVPEGYDVIPTNKGGGIGFRPAVGSEKWGTMIDEVGAMNNIVGGYGDLLTMAQNGTGSQGAWEATRATMINDMRSAFKTGSLDQGSLDFFNQLIPSRWDDFKINPKNWGVVQEKLKTGLKLMQGRAAQVNDKWLVDPSMIPNRYSGAMPVPGKDIPPPPTESPFAARKALEGQRDAAPDWRSGRANPKTLYPADKPAADTSTTRKPRKRNGQEY